MSQILSVPYLWALIEQIINYISELVVAMAAFPSFLTHEKWIPG